MLEIQPKSRSSKDDHETVTKWEHSENVIDELKRIRKNLLLSSHRNVSRFTIVKRNSLRLTEEQAKNVASMLPDEVIHHPGDYKVRKFEAAVLFADISGFTDLSEKYQSFDNGASKLSQVLNFYLGSMVQEILSHGGDIIKYAGDAFLAVFRAENELKMQETIQQAIDTALIIQKNYSNYRTEMAGVTLNVKIAISGGLVHFALIGNDKSSHYAIIGDPVWQVKMLQEIIQPGETLVTAKAWFFAQESRYNCQYFRESRHYKVTEFKDSLEMAQKQHEAILNFYEMKKKMDEDASQASASVTFNEPSIEHFALSASDKNESYSLRRGMDVAMDVKSGKFLRRFIIAPVLSAIDLNESIEFLNEMRHVVIVFANFVVAKSSSEELIEIVDGLYNKLYGIVTSHEGTVNKVSLFDKDVMFLIIFGLRGLKHKLDSRIALRCAAELHETFKPRPELLSVSIGVTSGMTYCGVVGHTLRREYSVISMTVNKAARLMMAYPSIVSCDQETLLFSKMDLKHFTILPKKDLKGLHGEVLAYEFEEVINIVESSVPSTQSNLILGRNEVLFKARSLLRSSIVNFNQEAKHLEPYYPKTSCFVIKGDTQQGKTRVLDEIFARCYRDGLHCLRFSLSIRDLKIPFGVIRRIVGEALKLGGDDGDEEKTEAIMCDLNVQDFLSVLNKIFLTKFEATETVEGMQEETISELTSSMFKILCTQAFREFLVVLIDDFEYTDPESFTLLESLFQSNSIFIFLTLGQQWKLSDEHKEIFKTPEVTQYRLEPINLEYQNEIACQSLNVIAMSLDLETYLHKNSNGNPGWIETCVKSLLQSEKLEVKTMSIEEAIYLGMVHNKPISAICNFETESICREERAVFDHCYKTSKHFHEAHVDVVRVAVLKNFNIQKEVASVEKGNDELMTYDSLTSYEQLVCKCAATLGSTFKRHMLFYVMSNSTDRMLGKALVKLFELQIIGCSAPLLCEEETSQRQKKMSDVIVCNCTKPTVFNSCRDLPIVSCCELIKFQRAGFQSVVYDLLTDKQRSEYHRRALVYLHMETNRCGSCGGGKFQVLMLEDFDFKFHDGVINNEDTSYESMVSYFESTNLPVHRKKGNGVSEFFRSIWNRNSSDLRPVVLNYLNYDFRSCKCESILYTAYSEMIKHCEGGGMKLKLIETMIQVASMSIKHSNVSRAIGILRKALIKLDDKSLGDEEPLYLDYLRCRALTLQGICASWQMQTENAMELYTSACKVFNISFPKRFDFIATYKLSKLIRGIKSSLKLKKVPKCSRLFSLITIQESKIFSLIFELLFKEKEFDLAKLAAFWSLRKILKYERNFSDVTRSFTNVLKIVFYTGCVEKFRWMQSAALVQVNWTLFIEGLDLNGLRSVIKLYHALMKCQMARSGYQVALKMGESAKQLCSRVQQTTMQTELVPSLFLLLIKMKRMQDACTLLQRFNTAMRYMKDRNGLIWYYALSMDVLLDTSLTVETYEACDEFFLNEITTFHKDGEPEAKSRFFANLLLWCVRHKVDEMAQIWQEHLNTMHYKLESRSSLNSTFTGLRIMEALTLQLSLVIEDRNMDLFEYYDEELKGLIKLMSSKSRISNCFSERFELHRIHLKLVKKFDEKHFKKLDKLMDQALNKKNYCSYDVINHNQKSWTCQLPAKSQNFWMKHSTASNRLNLRMMVSPDRIFQFSLPIPKSGNF